MAGSALHRCPVPGCRVAGLSANILMCAAHWRKVPKHLKIRVWRAWNDGQPVADYWDWRARAIAAAGVS